MKKIYLFLMIGLISTGIMAQKTPIGMNPAVKQQLFVKGNVTPVDVTKSVDAALNEAFEGATFPPSSWSLSTTVAWYISTDAAVAGIEGMATGATGHFATFDAYNENVGVASSLITPVLHPVAGNNTLSYKVNLVKVSTNPGYQGTGASMFIEFSTDGGTTWTTSTTNVLATLPTYNTATSGWQTLTASLAAYNNGTVQVRFRAVSDYGWCMPCIDDITGPNADIVTFTNELNLLSTYADFAGMSYYAVTPLSQAIDVNLTGVVVNGGSAAQNAVTLHADDVTNAVNATSTPYISNAGAQDTVFATTAVDNTNPANYGFKMWVTQTETDENLTNNTGDSIYFSTDPTLYFRTMSLSSILTPYSFGTGAPATTGMEYGANYHFMNADQVDSISVIIYGANGTGTVTGKLYDINLSTGARTVVAQTAAYTPAGTPEFKTLALTTPYAVTAGKLLTATVAMTFNTAANDTIKIGADGAFPGDAAVGGAAYLKVSGTWGWYSVTNTCPIVGLVVDNATGMNTLNMSKDVFVYPNPTSNTLFVMNQKAVSVEIFTLTGELVAKYNNLNVINVADFAQGTYVVKVVTDSKVITEKINIVH